MGQGMYSSGLENHLLLSFHASIPAGTRGEVRSGLRWAGWVWAGLECEARRRLVPSVVIPERRGTA